MPENCDTHSDRGCAVCAKGYDVTTSGDCSLRDALPGCNEMAWAGSAAEDVCAACMDGFLLNTVGHCEELTREVDENCGALADATQDVDQWGWCNNCAEGYEVDGKGGCQEVVNGPLHCESHDESGKCSRCGPG